MDNVKKEKADCYKCQYRGSISVDTHSCCHYPGTKTGILDMFGSDNHIIATKLKIQAQEHGIGSGWFFWPVNFDPAWLINCNGFKLPEQKEGNNE